MSEIKKILHTQEIHSTTLDDHYFWLRDIENDSDVKTFLNVENERVESELSSVKDLKEKLFLELKARKNEVSCSAPAKDGEYFYYERLEKGREYTIHCRKKGDDGKEQVILDENELAEGLDYFCVGAFSYSYDHRYLAYGVDTDGSEKYKIYVKDLKTGETLKECIEESYYGLEWHLDNKSFLYTVVNEELRPYMVRRHELSLGGENLDGLKDEILYTEASSEFHVYIDSDLNGEHLYIKSGGSVSNEVYFLKGNDSDSQAVLFQKRMQDIEYYPAYKNGEFLILSNKDHQNFSFFKCDFEKTKAEDWKEFISGSDTVYYEDYCLFEKYLVLSVREGGLQKFIVHSDNGQIQEIPFKDQAYCLYEGDNYEYQANKFRYEYSSPSDSRLIYDYDLETGETILVKTYPSPNVDSSDYIVKRDFAKSLDGELIPISILHKKGIALDGSHPAYLYGYGSYGSNINPSFDSNVFSLVDRGFIFAIGHVRGSSTMGRAWYENGKYFKKKNSFDDFAACANYLIENQYTRSGEIAINGGSAGGLLVCATMNFYPELFKCVVGDVPFVDVLNTMLDSSLPLTPVEYTEWGNPEADKDYFEYIKSYCPYTNIEKKDYPHFLATAGINDPRVTYWEPAKFVAKLREYKTNDNLCLLKTNMGGGHFGATGRFEYLKEEALAYSFILKCFGIEA